MGLSSEQDHDYGFLALLVIAIICAGLLQVVAGDFGVDGQAGTDPTHLDRPRYVRLADNGSMLISDDHRILEVDAGGQIVWEIRGTYCDITWIDDHSWAALNGTSTSACTKVQYNNWTTVDLPHRAHRIRAAGGDLVVGGMHTNITRVTRSGTSIEACEFVTGYISDLSLDHYLYDGDLYDYDLSTCSSGAVATPPADTTYSFHPMANGTFAYGVGWNNGSRAVVWENWTSWITSFPEDLAWNGTTLAVADLNAHIVRTWLLNETTQQPADEDGDGVLDQDDDCPSVWGNSTVDRVGCPDRDGDGTSDLNDPCPTDPQDGCLDSDGDGYNNTVDDCVGTWGNSTEDLVGCPDRDGDGTSDGNDPCPDDPLDKCDDPPPDPGQLTIISYDWNITNRSAMLTIWLNDTSIAMEATIDGGGPVGTWAGWTNPYQWLGGGFQPNTTYTFSFHFENATSETWLNFTDTTDPDPTIHAEVEFTNITETIGNTSYTIRFDTNTQSCSSVLPPRPPGREDIGIDIGDGWWSWNFTYLGLATNQTYHFRIECGEELLIRTIKTLADPESGDGGDGDGDGNVTPPDGEDGDGDGLGILEVRPAGLPLSVVLIAATAMVFLSLAIAMNLKQQEPLLPPEPFLTDLDEPDDITIPMGSPDLFEEFNHPQPDLPFLPSPDRFSFPEAPSPVPRDIPYLAVQVAEAEDLPEILERLRGLVVMEVSEENHKVLKDVQDLEKRLRQLRDDRDIAPRKYDKLLREVEDLKGAVQNLTPVLKRERWDV